MIQNHSVKYSPNFLPPYIGWNYCVRHQISSQFIAQSYSQLSRGEGCHTITIINHIVQNYIQKQQYHENCIVSCLRNKDILKDPQHQITTPNNTNLLPANFEI